MGLRAAVSFGIHRGGCSVLLQTVQSRTSGCIQQHGLHGHIVSGMLLYNTRLGVMVSRVSKVGTISKPPFVNRFVADEEETQLCVAQLAVVVAKASITCMTQGSYYVVSEIQNISKYTILLEHLQLQASVSVAASWAQATAFSSSPQWSCWVTGCNQHGTVRSSAVRLCWCGANP